jgi:hypothetical protein
MARLSSDKGTNVGWKDINLGLMHAMDFSIKAQHVILPLFKSASNALDAEWKAEEESYRKSIADAYKLDESEGSIMSSEKDWMEDIYRQRQQGVGSLALDWLMNALKDALHGAKTYLDKSHPAKGRYQGDGWLARIADEYQKRFGIDLSKGPMRFERIQELVLARNAGIHRSEDILDEYLKKIDKPAFVDDEDRFFVTYDALVQIAKECEQLTEWVVKEIEKLPLAKKQTDSEMSAQPSA